MMYEYSFVGMHLLWWVFWVAIIFVMFGWFEPVPKKRIRRDLPVDILQKRFATGEITTEEYHEKKTILEPDLARTAI